MGEKVNTQAGLPADVDPNDPSSLRDALRRSTELLRRWNGEGLDPSERVITVGEAGEALGPLGVGIGDDGTLIGGVPTFEDEESTVSGPSNLSASGAFEAVLLDWDGTDQAHYAFTEVWRNTTDNLSTATLRGQSVPGVFSDPGRPDTTYYYWVRFISDSGKPTAFNDTAGTPAHTALDPATVRKQITARSWSADTLYRSFEVVSPRDSNGDFYTNSNGVPLSYQAITGGTTGSSEPAWPTTLGSTVSDGSVTWEAIDAGEAPLIIGSRNGDPVVVMPGVFIEDATIEDAKIKELSANKVMADQLSAISADLGTITAGSISGVILDIGGSGGEFAVASDGSTEIRNANGDVQVRMNGSGNAEFSGTLTANAVDAVDTLNLRDQAVTFPVAVYSGGASGISGSWSQYQSLSIDTTGAPVMVTVSFMTYEDIWNYASEFTGYAYVRIKRNGSTIADLGQFAEGHLSYGTDYGIFVIAGTGGFSHQIKDTPSAGSNKYTFEVKSSIPTHVIAARSIAALEVKR